LSHCSRFDKDTLLSITIMSSYVPYILAYKSLSRISRPPLKIESVCGPKSVTHV